MNRTHAPLPVRLAPSLCVACLGGLLALTAAWPVPAAETTLQIDPTVEVDLSERQREAERQAALQRAKDVAALPGAREREALVPEILLVQRKVLGAFKVVSAHPEPTRQTWRIAPSGAPSMYAERVILRLMLAGFSSGKACPGEEWSGAHGVNRAAVIAERSTVAIVLVPAADCP